MAFLTRNIWRSALWFRQTVATIGAVSLAVVSSAAPAPSLRESEIKATAIYNIVAFTEWPATAFASAEAPLIVGVLGHGPVATVLDGLVMNETWHGRRVLLQHFSTPAEARNCHVLFIAGSEHARWRGMNSQFARRPILTICDAENFARQGGVLQLGIERNKLHLTVNLGVARANGLVISSKVLRLAEVIDDSGP
jgi:hypothetical protein